MQAYRIATGLMEHNFHGFHGFKSSCEAKVYYVRAYMRTYFMNRKIYFVKFSKSQIRRKFCAMKKNNEKVQLKTLICVNSIYINGMQMAHAVSTSMDSLFISLDLLTCTRIQYRIMDGNM